MAENQDVEPCEGWSFPVDFAGYVREFGALELEQWQRVLRRTTVYEGDLEELWGRSLFVLRPPGYSNPAGGDSSEGVG